MRWKLCLFLTLIILCGCIPNSLATAGQDKVSVIIGFADKPEPALVQSHGGQVKRVYKVIPAVSCDISAAAVERLRANPAVTMVEVDATAQALGQVLPWGVDRIEAEKVHPVNEGAGVQVAVVDTGVDYTHPDLSARYAGGYDFYNEDPDPMDDHSHGTHCAGIIAASDNGIGVIGVAPETQIYAVKVLSSSGSGYISDIVAGIEWATLGPDGVEGNQDDAEVISLSLGTSYGSYFLEEACKNAVARGTLVVAAAGNSGTLDTTADNVLYPAKYASVIAVAATDSWDRRASFSSTGPAVELSAPGVSIYSTVLNGAYGYKSGTSMACPHVSGAAALVFSSTIEQDYDTNNNGSWDPEEVRRRLTETATDLGEPGRDPVYGYGLVNAVAAASTPPSTDPSDPPFNNVAVWSISSPSPVTQGETVPISITLTNSGEVDAIGLPVYVKDASSLTTLGSVTLDVLRGATVSAVIQWDTSEAAAGAHTLVAYHTAVDDNPLDDEAYTGVIIEEPASPPPEPETPQTVHVADIDGAISLIGKSGKWIARFTLTVHDQSHAPLPYVKVTAAVTGAAQGSFSSLSDQNGVVVFEFTNLKSSSITLTVTNLESPEYAYNPEDNHDPDGDSDGSTITLTR